MNTPETLKSFAFVDDDTDVVIVDRSCLERYATCPAQARFIDSGLLLNESSIAAAGTAVHDAFGEAIQTYLDDPSQPVGMVAESVMVALRSARPDIQPAALAAGRPAAWSWARFISNYFHSNILRFDGGSGERSGQLSADMTMGDLTLRITGEVDLLLATPAKQVLRLVDYKSGWKRHGTDSIAASFQFGVYSWLVLQNYPEVEAVEVQVWLTRTNTLTYPVTFERSRSKEIETRIRAAAGEYVLHRNRKPQETPTWPAVEKCSLCPAAALCPASGHIAHILNEPEKVVDEMVAMEAKLDAMRLVVGAFVEARGKDIVSPSGAAFGTGKPKANRKPTKALYSVKTTGDAEE